MNARRMGTAFLLALSVSGACTWVLSRKMAAHAEDKRPEQHYVAASKPLDAGQVIKAEDLTQVGWSSSSSLSGAFAKSEDVIGRSLLYPVEKDQPVTEKLLAASGSGAGLAGRIPPGMRAIALRSDEVMGVAGFLFPGSHLDVLVTYHSDKAPEPTTVTVLQDAEVLAAGQKVQPDPEGKPVTATVVTLLLSPEDAQRAVLASTQGAIHFVLRSGADRAHVQEPALMLSQLSGQTAAAAVHTERVAPTPVAARHPVEAVKLPTFTVDTINGDKLSSDSFNRVN